MHKLLVRQPRLPDRLLSRRELDSAQLALSDQAATARLLAKRFAAKEALIKALGKASGLGFGDASIVHDQLGKPNLVFSTRLASQLPSNTRAHLSISDEEHYAVAMVVLEAAHPL